jgi:hypothetical protein
LATVHFTCSPTVVDLLLNPFWTTQVSATGTSSIGKSITIEPSIGTLLVVVPVIVYSYTIEGARYLNSSEQLLSKASGQTYISFIRLACIIGGLISLRR